ncbi:S8 family peptidase [Flavobacterium lacus]|uniref:Putative secreted protein (Por secretion system target) n=1 Tax=Flavobacterium lacus TaxID=1353778 RepID=A0A328WNT9_9FLAO|nr:S8 family peptidase [Flavobacterium lacus]RAR46816.1 putative secreted protein (Por secretion system target) [Flavobacterium lacus]
MIKKLLILFSILFSILTNGQTRKNQFHLNSESNKHELHLSFKSDLVLNNKDAILNQFSELEGITAIFQLDFIKSISFSDEKWNELERNAILLNGNAVSIAKLKNIFKVIVDNPTNDRLFFLATQFEQFESVEYASLISLEPIKPPFDIPPTTPDFFVNQTYVGPNPGLNMSYAWEMGLKGAGIRVRDVEYGFNSNHEDLNEVNAFIASGMTISSDATATYTEHGTAVFGIIIAGNDGYGITGLAHDATEMVLYPEWQEIGYDRIYAVNQSIQNSTVGDIIIYEMQDGVGAPAESNSVIWDLTKAASDAGIVVVAAAGNGNQNLDEAIYADYMSRGNSGAIIVGAGTPDLNHFRFNQINWWGSTYGSRVDLQGWARNVFTCGYGTAIMINNDINQGYTNFSGTSAATPMVAACAIVLQSYHHSLTGNYLTGTQLRTILKETGIPQGNPVTGNVGPFPNMQTALQRVYDDYLLGLDSVNETEFTVFPNPVQNQLKFLTQQDLSEMAAVEIFNALGQSVFQSMMPNEKQVDVSNLSSGMYFVKVSDGNQSATKKIIKK